MNEIVKKALNRGAPIDTPITFDLHELIVALEIPKIYEDYKKCCNEVISQISNIIDIFGGSFILPTHVTISIGENNAKELRFSGENFFFAVAYLLTGLDFDKLMDIYDDFSKFDDLKKDILQITSPAELNRKYPTLYHLYTEQVECNENLLELERMANDRDISIQDKLAEVGRITNNFKSMYSDFDLKREQQFAKDFTLTLFLERMMRAIDRILANAEEIFNIYYGHTIDINCLTPEDEDKFNLYIAAKFVNMIETQEDKQRYLFYLTNYFKENVETQVKRIKIKVGGRKVTPISLYERYKTILVNNPELLAVNFTYADFRDMTKEEIEEFIVEYLKELSANWELIPHDDTSIERTVRTIAKRRVRNLTEEERKIREKKLIDLYMRKKKFWDSTDPYFRIKGKKTFDGYVGYIYANALVALEKYYDDVEKTKIADGEAIYFIGMKDFYELSQLPKMYLMASPLVRRVIHKGAWEKKALKYINQKNSSVSPAEETKKLMLEDKVSINEKKL